MFRFSIYDKLQKVSLKKPILKRKPGYTTFNEELHPGFKFSQSEISPLKGEDFQSREELEAYLDRTEGIKVRVGAETIRRLANKFFNVRKAGRFVKTLFRLMTKAEKIQALLATIKNDDKSEQERADALVYLIREVGKKTIKELGIINLKQEVKDELLKEEAKEEVKEFKEPIHGFPFIPSGLLEILQPELTNKQLSEINSVFKDQEEKKITEDEVRVRIEKIIPEDVKVKLGKKKSKVFEGFEEFKEPAVIPTEEKIKIMEGERLKEKTEAAVIELNRSIEYNRYIDQLKVVKKNVHSKLIKDYEKSPNLLKLIFDKNIYINLFPVSDEFDIMVTEFVKSHTAIQLISSIFQKKVITKNIIDKIYPIILQELVKNKDFFDAEGERFYKHIVDKGNRATTIKLKSLKTIDKKTNLFTNIKKQIQKTDIYNKNLDLFLFEPRQFASDQLKTEFKKLWMYYSSLMIKFRLVMPPGAFLKFIKGGSYKRYEIGKLKKMHGSGLNVKNEINNLILKIIDATDENIVYDPKSSAEFDYKSDTVFDLGTTIFQIYIQFMKYGKTKDIESGQVLDIIKHMIENNKNLIMFSPTNIKLV